MLVHDVTRHQSDDRLVGIERARRQREDPNPQRDAGRNPDDDRRAEPPHARRGDALGPLLPRYQVSLWAGLDSNQRSGNATGLQPVHFGHSGTDPGDLI